MSHTVRIALDAMGGDHGPAVVVAGADLALARHPESEFLFFGNTALVAPLLASRPALKSASRLVHSVGIIAMGRVMEVAFQICQARTFDDFRGVLESIRDQTHWTHGKWVIGNSGNVRERVWNEFQSTHPDIQLLSDHLDRLVRQSYRKQQEAIQSEPLRAAVG